jgi:HK97 family phage major capsid protein
MNFFIRSHRHLVSLVLVLSVAVISIAKGFNPIAALFIVGLFQLAQMARSKPQAGVFYIAALSAEQVEEFQDILRCLKAEYPNIKEQGGKISTLEKLFDGLQSQVRTLKRAGIGSAGHSGVRWIGNVPFVTDECAKSLTSIFVLDCSRTKGALEQMVPDEAARQRILQLSLDNLGVQQRGGGVLSTTDVPLPTIFMPQIVELVFAYGAARQYATLFPLGSGQVKLPRLKAGEDDFGYLGIGTAGMSQNVPQKEVTAELVTFNANKMGGLIRIPTELEEDTFIPVGQFLARYIARQFAKTEDKTLFLGDGTPAYANQTGISAYCVANTAYLLRLGAGKTMPSNSTVDDFRNLRAQVNPAILGNMAANGQTNAAYYLHPSFEPLLRSFNKYPNFVIFETVNGKPMFDGWPVRWIGVSQPYSETAVAPSTPLAFFGDLSYWYLGERGTPRVEISREVFFQTDELAMRALERIDIETMAIDAMATLMTAAQ